MNEQLFLSIIEMFISIIIEGVLLSMIFAFIANQSSEKQNSALKSEMSNMEVQGKFNYEQIMKELQSVKTELISQIKEANYEKGGNDS